MEFIREGVLIRPRENPSKFVEDYWREIEKGNRPEEVNRRRG
ncbi:MAG: hypothetical protein QXH47_07360 [Candidatus Bathyarchaeia archaeon]